MTKFFFPVSGLISGLVLGAAGLAAHQAAQFRTITELVSVDTIVTTADGQPATDLTTKDFVLKVDGKVRPIQSVQFVRFNESSTSAPVHPGTSAPAPFATNTDPKGRTFIFAIDHNNIHPGNERPAIDAAIRLLDRLTPNDRVAVVTLPRGGVAADLSTDRVAARKALEGIIGHAPRRSAGNFGFSLEEALTVFGAGNVASVSSDFTKKIITEMVSRECGTNSVCGPAVLAEAREYGRALIFNTRDTMLALSAFMAGLSSLEGTKSIVFISEGLIETPDNRGEFNELGRVADTSRVRMFVIQLNTPIYDVTTRKAPANTTGDIALELSGLQNIAGVTGGEIFRPSGRVDSAMAQIDRATSAYYLVGFEPNDKLVVLAETLGTGTMTSAAFAVISESGGQGAEWIADAVDLATSPVVTAGAVQPGRYRVRVAAGDALGRSGAVDVMLDAQLTDAWPLQVSSLMPGRLANGGFQPRLDFAGLAEITGFVELYNVPLLAGVPTVKFELAETPEGPAIATADATLAATAMTDRWIARGTVGVPPGAPKGDLILRARILLDGKAVGTVTRAIRR